MTVWVCGTARGKRKQFRCGCCGFESDLSDAFAVSSCWDCVSGNLECETCIKHGVPVDRFPSKRGKLHRFRSWAPPKGREAVFTVCGDPRFVTTKSARRLLCVSNAADAGRIEMFNDVYYSPEKCGLEMLGEIDWDDAGYQFNLTAVWRSKETGQLYWGDDSGCSCPTPFEDVTSVDELTAGTPAEFQSHLEARINDGYHSRSADDLKMEVVNLMERVTG